MIDSLDLQTVSSFMVRDDWASVLLLLERSVRNLLAAGAEVLLLATNTPHKVYPQLVKQVSVPFPSIMDATAVAIAAKKLRKVALLGTRITMQSDFYQEAFKSYNIEIIVPSEKDQIIINDVIWKELTFHIITPESKEKYLKVISSLHQQGAEGVILGCTEIPLLIQQTDSAIPVFDTTFLHAMAALKLALE